MGGTAAAEPALVGLAPAPVDDARKAIAIGPQGQVYEPDGKGAWLRTRPIATATTLASVARAGVAVVATGGGVIYQLAPTGWSAIRLAQRGPAVLSRGTRAVGAVGKQIYALDRFKNGEPEKVALLPQPIVQLGSGASIVAVTAAGVVRIEGTKVTPLAGVPKLRELLGDRWALVDGGAFDLRAKQRLAWPAGVSVIATGPGPDGALAAVAKVPGGKLELVVIGGKAKLVRSPIDTGGPPAAKPVGVVVDRAGRALVALVDGRLLVRTGDAWTATTVGDALPAARPGSPPASSR